MESIFKPPRTRRPHSSSLSGPYDDVVLSNNRGQRTASSSLDYVEIFSGSLSSIPVLDLSSLEDRSGSAEARSSSSKLDYSSIFGGFRNDDVAAPYEELFSNGSSTGKKKAVKPRSSSNTRSLQQESVSPNSPEKTKNLSTDTPDRSFDAVKKHFNLSFNKTSQGSIGTSNGKTHVAQLHAIPGFAYLVDGTTPPVQKTEPVVVPSLKREVPPPVQKTEPVVVPSLKCEVPPPVQKTEPVVVPSLKREVSRTWSFSGELGKVNGRLSHDNTNIPDRSYNVNEINLKTQSLNVPNSSYGFSDDVKDSKISRISKIASIREDSSEKIGGQGQQSPPLFDEALDENSAALALKKAIDQAQEIITIAKMIMEKKKKGFEERPKTRSRSRWKVKDKQETRADLEAFGFIEKDAGENSDRLDSYFSAIDGVDRKFTSSLAHDDVFVNAIKGNMDRVQRNVETAVESGELSGEVNKISSSYKEEMLSDKVNVKAAKEFEGNLRGVGKRLAPHDRETEEEEKPVENVITETRTANLESGNIEVNNNIRVASNEFASQVSEIESGKETLELEVGNRASNDFASQASEIESGKGSLENVVEVIHHKEGQEAVAELVDNEIETSKNTQDVDICDEQQLSEECQENFDHVKGHENMVEVTSISHKTEEEILHEAEEDQFVKEKENVTENNGNSEKMPAEKEEVLSSENITAPGSEHVNLPNDSCIFPGKVVVKEEEMVENCKGVSEWIERDQQNMKLYDVEESWTGHNKDHALVENEQELGEALVGKFNSREPKLDDVEKKVIGSSDSDFNINKPDSDGHKLPGECEESELKATPMNAFEDKAAESIGVEANDCAEVQKTETSLDAIATNHTSEVADRFEENNNERKSQEDVCKSGNSVEAGDLCSNYASHVTGEVLGNDKAEDCQRSVDNCEKTSVDIPEVGPSFITVDWDNEANQISYSEDDEMPKTEGLHQSSMEEIFNEINLQNVFEGLSCDESPEDDDVLMEKIHAHELSDEDQEVHEDSLQESADITINPYLTESLYSNLNRAAFDFVDVTPEPKQVQDNNEDFSASSLENMDVLSAHECEEHQAQEVDEVSSDKDEQKDEPESISNVTQQQSKYKEVEKDTETEKPLEETESITKKSENLTKTSTMEEKNTKENAQDFNKAGYQQRIEAIKREKEREKNRIAVERAIREARERAFAEARERAERAAVERAAAEARQRVLADAKEKLEKTTTKQTVDKISNEAKLKAERAAVERALAEARERAREKAKTQAASASRSNELKHSFSASDLEKFNGANTESAQRNKARLERHQRIMERAAKALAEKNMRDLIAQKEQAERNRLSESLDAEIKRWAAGKEGNLRALLSTLQYILGPQSGWQPISLTEIITTAAVKKAYRKATLYVHPDKLQQRGASIQQKYICEKVFDLLKAAWNKFNSEER